MRRFLVTGFGVLHGLLGDPNPSTGEEIASLSVNGCRRAATVITPYDPARHKETYKVFSHIYDFQGDHPVTKGLGGFDTHQRGICIGWRMTRVGQRTLDSWHMKDCSQRAVPRTLETFSTASGMPGHRLKVDWRDAQNSTFIQESRQLTILPDSGNVRLIEVASELISRKGEIQLRGDHHHAGMQIRLANEVCRHPWNVRFTIPRHARWARDESVLGGSWICCRFTVRGKAHSLLHMTPPRVLDELPIYSARAYGRLGAFFERTLQEGNPFRIRSVIALSERPLDEDDCEDLFRMTCS
mgnify:CR=1 FL=1